MKGRNRDSPWARFFVTHLIATLNRLHFVDQLSRLTLPVFRSSDIVLDDFQDNCVA